MTNVNNDYEELNGLQKIFWKVTYTVGLVAMIDLAYAGCKQAIAPNPDIISNFDGVKHNFQEAAGFEFDVAQYFYDLAFHNE